MVFDVLQSVEALQEAGIPEPQAKAHVRLLQGVVESDLATKHDLEELRKATAHDLNELRQATARDLNELRQATKLDLKELELRLTIKLGSLVVVVIGLLVALSRLNLL